MSAVSSPHEIIINNDAVLSEELAEKLKIDKVGANLGMHNVEANLEMEMVEADLIDIVGTNLTL